MVGPESSGKTTLARALSEHCRSPLVPDPSRAWLEAHGPIYSETDIPRIAAFHVQQEASVGEPHLVFIDTDMLNYRIWSLEKFGRVDAEVERLVSEVRYDQRLLCRPDLPWEPDPLRENPHDRERLFEVWGRELKTLGLPYTVIEGTLEERITLAVRVVDRLIL